MSSPTCAVARCSHTAAGAATRRIVVGTVCALTVSSLLMPSISLAAEWVDVGGVRHEAAAGPTGDAAGTWSWDGADDMKLNGYNGGAIEAAGKLNVSYEGNNTVTNDDGRGIKVKDGANENAELNIQGDASSTLNVTSSRDAITSVGNINIDGAGTVNATSTEHDAIDAGAMSPSRARETLTPRAIRMASGPTATSRSTTAEPSPPRPPRIRVSMLTRTSS